MSLECSDYDEDKKEAEEISESGNEADEIPESAKHGALDKISNSKIGEAIVGAIISGPIMGVVFYFFRFSFVSLIAMFFTSMFAIAGMKGWAKIIGYIVFMILAVVAYGITGFIRGEHSFRY